MPSIPGHREATRPQRGCQTAIKLCRFGPIAAIDGETAVTLTSLKRYLAVSAPTTMHGRPTSINTSYSASTSLKSSPARRDMRAGKLEVGRVQGCELSIAPSNVGCGGGDYDAVALSGRSKKRLNNALGVAET